MPIYAELRTFRLTASVIASHFKHRRDRLFRWNAVALSQCACPYGRAQVLVNSEVQAALGLKAATARELLCQLVAEGVAQTEGQRRGMRYVQIALR